MGIDTINELVIAISPLSKQAQLEHALYELEQDVVGEFTDDFKNEIACYMTKNVDLLRSCKKPLLIIDRQKYASSVKGLFSRYRKKKSSYFIAAEKFDSINSIYSSLPQAFDDIMSLYRPNKITVALTNSQFAPYLYGPLKKAISSSYGLELCLKK